ncbi:MAG: DUF5686 and carboxypeptidase regulatory-like domain-containing protein [Flammeovirgaceae bacterium]|nr:DUF5686 and carboxypeptidase regulatory-like domain-containing protein [Flammeovirgaceae bacterium]
MTFLNRIILSSLSLILSYGFVVAQITVRGKVTDASSGDPLPFVNVVFKGTSIGATTDFDGNYTITTSSPTDSLIASYIGYKSRAKVVRKTDLQSINFQLEELVTNLQEIVVRAGENPAFEILRNVVKNKNKNDKLGLTAYEYDTYTKIEIDVDNISPALREKRFMKKITTVLDSVDRIAGEDGKPILPLFITESVSKLYYRDDPSLKKELILKTKISGVGVEDGTTVSQLVGSSFQEYNFYDNWLSIVTKEFVSPIADGWRLYYEYDLTDSLYIGDHYCYRLDFFPKSPQDLAFTGTMWITKDEHALKQIDVLMGKQANVNFIEKIRIQQELAPTPLGPWVPVKNRVLIDVGELTKNSAGMLAKFYTSNKNIVVNQPKEVAFYERRIQMAEDANMHKEEAYWDTLRHEPLTETEKNVYKMIDTLKNIPIVKTYTDIIKVIVDGYIDLGKVELGPYLGLVAWNNIEGFRVQGGFKTNYKFSKRFIYSGTLAYGFDDSRIKFNASVQHILSRRRWTTMSWRVRSDVARVGVDDENLADNPLFLTATRWGYFRRGYYFDEGRVAFQRELFKGFTQKISVKHMTFEPTYNFGYLDPEQKTTDTLQRFQTTEVTLEARFARDELFIQNDNERISLGTDKWPVLTIRYTRGVKGVLGSDFNYHKVRLSLFKKIRTGPLGVGYLNLTGEYAFNTLPYPLLSLHLGNQSPLYSNITYNLMDFGEFISDHYASVQYRQYLEGFLLNRLPLIRKLKWRLLATSNVVVGGMRTANRNLIAPTFNSQETEKAGFFKNGKPYVEVGYGVENIFRFLRVDFVHRLTYIDPVENPDARKFGILFTVQFQL